MLLSSTSSPSLPFVHARGLSLREQHLHNLAVHEESKATVEDHLLLQSHSLVPIAYECLKEATSFIFKKPSRASTLPTEILLQIFGHFEPRLSDHTSLLSHESTLLPLVNCAAVCRRWNEVATPVLWKSPVMMGMSSFEKFVGGLMPRADSEIVPSEDGTELSKSKDSDKSSLVKLPTSTNIKHLTLSATFPEAHRYSQKLSTLFSSFILTVPGSTYNLKTLDIAFCKSISNFTLQRCAHLLRNLENLNLSGGGRSEICVIKVARECRQLKRLGLGWNSAVGDFCVKEVVRLCEQLEWLDLSGCPRVGDASCFAIAKYLGGERRLGVSSGSQVSVSGNSDVTEVDGSLESENGQQQHHGTSGNHVTAPKLRPPRIHTSGLILGNGMRLMSPTSEHLESFLNSPQIQEIAPDVVPSSPVPIPGANSRTLNAAEPEVVASPTTLGDVDPASTGVHLNSCNKTHESQTTASATTTQTSFTPSFNNPINNSHRDSQPTGIKYLSLNYCTLITNTGVKEILEKCGGLGRLRVLNVQGCHEVRFWGIHRSLDTLASQRDEYTMENLGRKNTREGSSSSSSDWVEGYKDLEDDVWSEDEKSVLSSSPPSSSSLGGTGVMRYMTPGATVTGNMGAPTTTTGPLTPSAPAGGDTNLETGLQNIKFVRVGVRHKKGTAASSSLKEKHLWFAYVKRVNDAVKGIYVDTSSADGEERNVLRKRRKVRLNLEGFVPFWG
jgi:hypothetical protein